MTQDYQAAGRLFLIEQVNKIHGMFKSKLSGWPGRHKTVYVFRLLCIVSAFIYIYTSKEIPKTPNNIIHDIGFLISTS